jgi:cytochrome P450
MLVDFRREKKRHLSFGTGHHMCPGRHLARAEVRITLEEWIAGIPEFSLAPDATVTFTGGVVGVVDTLPLVWEA